MTPKDFATRCLYLSKAKLLQYSDVSKKVLLIKYKVFPWHPTVFTATTRLIKF